MFRSSGSFTFRYGVAIASVTVAIVVRLLLASVLAEQYVFSPVLLAVLVTASFGGFRPALAAVALGALGAELFLLEARGDLFLGGLADHFGLLLFVITGVGVALLGGAMHSAQHALREVNAALEERVYERTSALESLNEKLRQSEAYFRPLVEGASRHAIFMLDLEGRVAGWNAVAQKMKGYSAEEIIGRHFSCFYPPEGNARAIPARALTQALTEGRFSDEGYRIRKDGSRFWANVTITPYFDEKGVPVGFVKVTQDITERKEAVDALRAERDKFATIVSTVPMVICSFRRCPGGLWSFPFAGPDIKKIYGFEAQELVDDASGIYERIHSQDRAHFLDTLRYSGSTMTPWRAEYRVMHPSRGKIWVEAHAVPCREPNGNLLWHGYLADITERKRAENALAERERMLQFVTSSVRAGLVVIGPDYRYLFANEAYGQIYGLDPKQIVGKTIPEVLPYVWTQIKPHLDEALRGEAGQFEITLPRLPGTDRNRTFFAIYEPRVREDGTPTSVVVVSDITSRKTVESALVDRERILGVVTGTIRVGLVVVGPDYRYWFANEAYADLFGLDLGDIVGRRVPEVLAIAWPQIQPRLDQALAGERVAYELELQAQADLPIRHLAVNYEPHHDESGILSVVVVVVDITERKVSEAALLESQAKLEVAMASMTDAVFISDTTGRLIHFNDAFVRYHRFSNRSECAEDHENYADIIEVFMDNGEPVPLEMWAVSRALRGETVANAEYRIRRKDSGESWIGSYSFSPIRDSEGTIVGSVVVGRDITERKRAEVEAAEREERFRQITENIREVFWLNDPIHGRILYVSPA